MQNLTTREQEVLDLLCQSTQRKEIAHALGISSKTLVIHIGNIAKKYGMGITKVVHEEIRARTRAEMSGHTYNIDARGSDTSADVELRTRRALAEAHTQGTRDCAAVSPTEAA